MAALKGLNPTCKSSKSNESHRMCRHRASAITPVGNGAIDNMSDGITYLDGFTEDLSVSRGPKRCSFVTQSSKRLMRIPKYPVTISYVYIDV